MQLIATGKWSKAEKQWKMVVAMRRPTATSPSGSSLTGRDQRPSPRQRPRKDPRR